MKVQTRRSFLDQALQALGLLGLVVRPAWSRTDEVSTTEEMISKAARFLRARQADDGRWS